MSFSINSNLAALTANLHMNQQSKALDESIAFLSSGSKLDNAAYDTSSLTIANQLSSQASGLGQSIMNANDSIGMMQVAESGLSNINDNMEQIRTLTLQASSPIMNASNKMAIQKEIDGLLEVSSNIAFSKIGTRIGAEKLYKYIRLFGFGAKTGIELPGEAKGLLRSLSRWSKLSVGVIPFGQEISVTPLQLITAISAIANGGNLMAPMIVSSIDDKDKKIKKEFKPKRVRRVVSSQISSMLR